MIEKKRKILISRFSLYLQKLNAHSSFLASGKILRKVSRLINQEKGKLNSWLFNTKISDKNFLLSLDSRFSSVHDYIIYMSVRKNPLFFLNISNKDEFITSIKTCCPDIEKITINVADQICDHVFDLLGSGPISLGKKINWNKDFKSGYRFNPRRYCTSIKPASYPGGYDIKVPWELSRFQHLIWLGQAYWFTDDEKYALEFTDQVKDWIEHNPPQYGVNWTCTMDVAIRVVNWLWSYYFFNDSPSLNEDFLAVFFKSLLSHGRHIMKNLEWSETFTSNHYLSNIVGLIYLGILMPEFKEASKWRSYGFKELEKEMFKQVNEDGVDFEGSIPYHRLVTELFLSSTLLALLNGHFFDEIYTKRLEKMLEFIMYITKPNGTIPIMGDNDNGRLHRLKIWKDPMQEWIDHRYLLAIGAVFFRRQDFASAAGDNWEEAVWFFGEKALDIYHKFQHGIVNLKSRIFKDVGFYIMRHNEFFLAVNTRQQGKGYHIHDDVLSFELFLNDYTLIGDPGIFLYSSNYETRALFRSKFYHNTVIINRKACNEIYNKKKIYEMQVKILEFKKTSQYEFFVAERRFNSSERDIVLRRWFYLNKDPFGFVTGDVIIGNGSHHMEVNFQTLVEHCYASSHDNDVLLLMNDNKYLIFLLEKDEWGCELSQGEYSPGYGTLIHSPKIRFYRKSILPAFLTLCWSRVSNDYFINSDIMNQEIIHSKEMTKIAKNKYKEFGIG